MPKQVLPIDSPRRGYFTCALVLVFLTILAHPWQAQASFGVSIGYADTAHTASVIFVGTGPAFYNMRPYYPLRSGSFWTYRYPDGTLYTMTVLPGTTVINGVETKAISDTDGYTQYLTNDSNGIRVHGQFDSSTGNWTYYSPAIQIFNSSQYMSQEVTSYGTAHTNFGDFPYTSSFTFTNYESVTVPLSSFYTLRQDGRITIGGSAYTYAINFAHGVGIVKEVQTPYPNSGKIELIATNVNIKTAFDFDGDGKSDAVIYGNQAWSISYSSPPQVNWFAPTTFYICNFVRCPATPWMPVVADYDGDGKADKAVYLNGAWGIVRSSDEQLLVTGFGGSAFAPVPEDYDGDGKADLAVYSDGVWSIMRSSDGVNQVVAHGGTAWLPVAADYDGDGKADVAVYHPSGVWAIKRSSDNQIVVIGHGGSSWQPVPADYDGDGVTDIAVYSDGMWSIVRSSDGGNTIVNHGGPGLIPVPADYDGDGKTDIAVYDRSGQWVIQQSGDGSRKTIQWGGGLTDVPVK